jgi:ribonuclease R
MAKLKNTKKDKTKQIPNLKDLITALFEENTGKEFSIKNVIKNVGARDKKAKEAVPKIVLGLEEEGFVTKTRGNNFVRHGASGTFTGTVDYVSSRYAYIVTEELEQDIWVKSSKLNNALDGDEVKVRITRFPKDGTKPEGEVVEILKRKRSEFVGRIEISPRYAFVIADNKKMHHDIFVRFDDMKDAKHNDKVLIQIKEWPERDRSPIGKVIQVLGPAGNNEAEIHSIMAEFGLPFGFPPAIEAQADKIKEKIEPAGRKDFRDVTTFTIDPEDAKDFDDAISIRILENGNYEIGVHIADVTHYIKADSELDKEALQRGTSVYLVDRTIPMLPEKLSNELCSLRPNEDKLTFSAVFEMDGNGKVRNQWFDKTIINSDRRFTYEEAQQRIESLEGDFAKELTILNELALKLKAERFMQGSINFETVEVKFRLDEKGKPLEVIPKVRKDAHKLIEEFMLLANKKVAEFIFSKSGSKNHHTFVYRTHDYPDPDKIRAFSIFAQKFGHKLNIDEEAISKSLNKLIEAIEGKPEQNVLEQLAIRTMAKAKYTTEEKSHFGLGFDHYTHFTSPIRRYPDMMSHRLLYHYLQSGKPVEKDKYEKQCLHSSDMEKRAAEAERASIKYKQVEYMQQFIGEEFDGVVSGVTEWGVYVELIETKCEGMVRLSQMEDDYYEFDEKNFRLIGKKNKKMISLGDKVKVKVVDTDIDRRTIDLEFS